MLEASFPPGGTGRSGRLDGAPASQASGTSVTLPGMRMVLRSAPLTKQNFPDAPRSEPACPFACSAMKQPGQSSMCLAMLFFTVRPARRKEELFVARRSEPKRNFPVAARPFSPRYPASESFFLRRRAAAPEHCPFLSLRGDKKTPSRASLFRPIPRFFARSVPARRPFCRPFRRTRSFFIYKHPG